MKTVEDLAELLNLISKNEFGNNCLNITEGKLKYFSLDSIPIKRYRTFYIRKKNGGFRTIHAPCQQLKIILTCINDILRSIYQPSQNAMGFIMGRSVVNNAQIHVGHNYVFNIDLKDFFSSISQARVWKRLQLPPFNFTTNIANVIAGLCCCYDNTTKTNVLPQGSPVSPLLTNAICDTLDRRLRGVAKRFGLHYSRYADDMTFSSMHNVYQNGSTFRTEIRRIITEQGFQINETKTRLQKQGTRQEVTGLTVNHIINVDRKYISDLRWMINIWEKEGYAKAYALFYPKYKNAKGHVKKGEPTMENVINGKLNYLRMVKGSNNTIYHKLQSRFIALQKFTFITNETEKDISYTYKLPYKLQDFETLFHTTISIDISSRGKIIGKCIINENNHYLSINKSTQNFLYQYLDDELTGNLAKALQQCYVILCHKKGKNFWLISNTLPKESHLPNTQSLKDFSEKILKIPSTPQSLQQGSSTSNPNPFSIPTFPNPFNLDNE